MEAPDKILPVKGKTNVLITSALPYVNNGTCIPTLNSFWSALYHHVHDVFEAKTIVAR